MAESERWYEKQRIELSEWSKTPKGRTHPYADIIQMLPDFGITLLRLVDDPEVTPRHKAFIGATVAYIASPVDLMPEGIMGPAGFADDLVVAAYALKHLLKEDGDNEPDAVLRAWAGTGDVKAAVDHALGGADDMVGKKEWDQIRGWLDGLFDDVDAPATQPTVVS